MQRKWLHGTADYPREYDAWKAARRRCTVIASHKYYRYGARGITMCEKWIDNFDAFMFDMGRCPPGLTLERSDNDGHYEPDNCIWSTRIAQARNTERAIARRKHALAHPQTELWEIRAMRDIKKAMKPPYIPPEPVHGSKRMYAKHKCRCSVCVETQHERGRRKYYNRSPEAHARRAEWLKEYRRKKRNQQEYDL